MTKYLIKKIGVVPTFLLYYVILGTATVIVFHQLGMSCES